MERNEQARERERDARYVLLPVGRQLVCALVVASQTVDAALDQNQAELGVLVLAELLQVLADGDGLLDQVVQVLRDGRGETCARGQQRVDG